MQKTADDVRISDWSSDVCSSDLPCARARDFVAGVDRPQSTRAAFHHRAGTAARPAGPEKLYGAEGRYRLWHRAAVRRLDAGFGSHQRQDRKRDVSGHGGSVLVDPGGRRTLTNTIIKYQHR